MIHDEEQEARRFLQTIKQRLVHLVDHRPFVFKETRQEDARAYLLQQKRLEGLTKAQIEAVEEASGGTLPTLFRVYLSEMGEHHGELFCGSVTRPKQYGEFREWAEELLTDDKAEERLAPEDFVFLFHQGYTYCYFKAEGGYDAPVYQYAEGQGPSWQVASGFASLLEGELWSMEHTNAGQHESGGFFVTVSPGGYITHHFPALNDGIRALDVGDRFLDA